MTNKKCLICKTKKRLKSGKMGVIYDKLGFVDGYETHQGIICGPCYKHRVKTKKKGGEK